MTNGLKALAAGIALIFLTACDGYANELIGLWQAKKNFGPEVRGTLTIENRDGRWLADIAGFDVEADVSGDEISFDIPGGRGGFIGKIGDGTLTGHWIQPRPAQIGLEVASPVHFTLITANRWRGEVIPRESEYTFYIPITEAEDGTLKVFLRNPDRNLGVFTNLKRVERDGNNLSFLGAFRWNEGEQVMAEGVYDPDYDQMTVFLPRNRGGTYDFIRVDDDSASGFYARGKNPEPYEYTAPPALDDGWQVGTLEEANISFAPIKEMIEQEIDPVADHVSAHDVHGILISRHGKLVFEDYFHGFHREVPHDTRSASKSLTSVLVGAAIEAGEIGDTSLPVYETMYDGALPEGLDPRAARMTLEHLITMSSGFYCDDSDYNAPGNEEIMQEQEEEPDWYKYTLNVPMTTEPGDVAVYCSANPNLAGGVLSTASGKSLPELFETLVAVPMDIRRYYLILQPSGEPYMGGGIHWMPRDFIKLGQLMLNGGTWNGQRIISEEWAERSTSALYPLRDRGYGYLWWLIEYPYKDRTVEAFLAGGNGGQVVIVVPELDLIINFWGGNYSDRILFKAQQVLVPEYILKAVAEGSSD